MFALIQHQQDRLISDRFRQDLIHRQTGAWSGVERISDCDRHIRLLLQLNEGDRAGRFRFQLLQNMSCQPGLADPRRSGNGEQASRLQQALDVLDISLPPDKGCPDWLGSGQLMLDSQRWKPRWQTGIINLVNVLQSLNPTKSVTSETDPGDADRQLILYLIECLG